MSNTKDLNVFDEPLQPCCYQPMTGYYRDGFCRTDETDTGLHVVCVKVTDEFLSYSFATGNDLITPRPQWQFPGLKDGDCWCVCALRWLDAYNNGVAPPVKLESTNKKVLEVVGLEKLIEHQLGIV
jgi:uncharacterized protein (DUF2237 family)